MIVLLHIVFSSISTVSRLISSLKEKYKLKMMKPHPQKKNMVFQTTIYIEKKPKRSISNLKNNGKGDTKYMVNIEELKTILKNIFQK